MPATYEGYVDVEATSEEEAARLALEEHISEVEWCDVEPGDECDAEVIDVYCDDPPDNAILIGKHPHAGNLDAVFGPDDLPTATQAQNQVKADDGANPCKEATRRKLPISFAAACRYWTRWRRRTYRIAG
jgi:hypothetical protein